MSPSIIRRTAISNFSLAGLFMSQFAPCRASCALVLRQLRLRRSWHCLPVYFAFRTAGGKTFSHSSGPVAPALETPDARKIQDGTHERHRILSSPSPEQQVAIDTLLHSNNNLIVEACAGSGKTTTILHLASAAPQTRFLVLVYNRRLMAETDDRVRALGLANTTVLNYHTLGARYYTPECATDQGLKRVVQDDMVRRLRQATSLRV